MTREEAKRELMELANNINLIPSSKKGQAMKMALDALEEQKTGEWEYIQYDANQNIGNWHCSNCRHIITMNIVPYYKYCPYCGAKMEVKEWYYI